MKKLLPLIFSLITLSVCGQTYSYISMPTTNAHWDGIDQGLANGLNFMQYPYSVYMQGDTLINGITYKSINQFNNIPSSFLYGLREDTTHKVYYIYRYPNTNGPTDDTSEHLLLYDFNMQVGQSFYDSLYNWRPTVIAIDTISTPAGLRRQFTISDKNGTLDSMQYDYWIEGVGSLRILANARMYCFESCYCLSYLTVQGQLTYQDTLSCMFTGITEVPLANIKLYPSPASSSITIDMQQCSSAITSTYTSISLYDALGQRVRSIPRQGSSKVVDLSVASMPDGIYLATITDQTGTEMMLGKFTVVK